MRQAFILISFVAIIQMLNPTSQALAFGRKSPNISIGPSFSYSTGTDYIKGPTYGIDATYLTEVGKKYHGPVWFSLGMRFIDNERSAVLVPYAEVGTWALITIGVGYSRNIGDGPVARDSVHGFFGVPFNLYGVHTPRKPSFYLEPYYRPVYDISRGDIRWHHEYGVMIKFTTAKVGSWNPQYD
jgi:hypothetical protein